jgi:hypothetical protein
MNMETGGTLNTAVAAIVGLITAIVSWRVLRKAVGIDSPMLGVCVGLLTGIGLASRGGGSMSALLIPYQALGIAVVVLLFLMPILKGKKGKDMKHLPPAARNTRNQPDDPWERELRRNGKMANGFGTRRSMKWPKARTK